MLRGWPASMTMLTAGLLSGGLVLAGCGAPDSDPRLADAAVPANIDCSRTPVAGADHGVEMGGGTSKKGKEKSGTEAGILVHGACTIVGVPDTAMLSAIVRVQAPTERLALDGVNGKAVAATAILKSKGIAQADIGGGVTQVVPVGSPVLRSASGIGGVQITGFAATRTITATLRDLATAGQIVSLVTDSTGDSGKVQVSYVVSDDVALRRQALTAAIHQARANAEQMAADSGVVLGNLAALEEVTDAPDQSQPGAYQESVDMAFAFDS